MAEHELELTEEQVLAEMQQALGISNLVEGPEWLTLAEMCAAYRISENTMRKIIHQRIIAGVLEDGEALRTDGRERVYRATVYRVKTPQHDIKVTQ